MAHTVRPYADSDAEALADFENAQIALVGIPPRTTAEEVRWWFSAGLVRDRERDARLYVDDAGTVIASATVGTPPAGGYRVFLGGGVAAEHRGRGLGRELFDWQFARAAEIHAAAGSDPTWIVEAMAEVRDTSRAALYAHRGLTAVRWFTHMSLNPADALPLAMPDGLVVRTYRPGDGPAVYAASEESFAEHYGHQPRTLDEWTEMMAADDAFQPDLSLIAWDGDEIAAHTLSFDAAGGVLLVGEVGTRPAYRRRGIAGALLSDLLGRAAAAGRTEATLDVDADSAVNAGRLYERIGFRATDRWAAYTRPF